MKPSLKPGTTHRFTYRVPENKTVPYTFPEAPEIAAMPKVFATGNMIVLMEWVCAQLIAPHLDPGEGSVGVHVDVSHLAATLPGMEVAVDVECVAVDGPRLTFKVKAHDGIDLIGEGRHERFVVMWDKFNTRLAAKAAQPNSPRRRRHECARRQPTRQAEAARAGGMMAESAPAISPSISDRSTRRRMGCCGSCSNSTAKWSSASIPISAYCIAAPKS